MGAADYPGRRLGPPGRDLKPNLIKVIRTLVLGDDDDDDRAYLTRLCEFNEIMHVKCLTH